MATYDSKHLLDPELIGIPSNPAAAPSVTPQNAPFVCTFTNDAHLILYYSLGPYFSNRWNLWLLQCP